jgi:ZIP family zinc transporter
MFSFVEIFPKAYDALAKENTEIMASWITAIAFFGGVLIILIIDKLVPSYENPHEPRLVEEVGQKPQNDEMKLKRMGLFAALAIAIHNFPEGIATFTSYMSDPFLGISIAVAIGLHNIPEGIAVSVPLYHATKDKKKSFWLGFSSGLAEPVGAIIGFLLLSTFLTQTGIWDIVCSGSWDNGVHIAWMSFYQRQRNMNRDIMLFMVWWQGWR